MNETIYKIFQLAYEHWLITSLFLILLSCIVPFRGMFIIGKQKDKKSRKEKSNARESNE